MLKIKHKNNLKITVHTETFNNSSLMTFLIAFAVSPRASRPSERWFLTAVAAAAIYNSLSPPPA
jgi:hypothetical protein